MLLEKSREIALEGMKRLSQSRKNAQLWMCLMVNIKSNVVVLEKTLESLLTARRVNQCILKEISPEYSLEGQMLKLRLQYFGHMRRRTDSFEKPLMLGKIEGRKRRG